MYKALGAIAALIVMLAITPAAGGQSGPSDGSGPCNNPTIDVPDQPGPTEVEGTNDDDVIRGSNGRDVIRGRGGDDTICGQRGNDDIFGNRGDDRLLGNQDEDSLIGGRGDDTANGGPNNDNCRAEVERSC